jgi:hypothetical protein
MGRSTRRWWHSPSLACEDSDKEAVVRNLFLKRHLEKVNYGVSVGAIVLLKTQIHSLRKHLEKISSNGAKVAFREIQVLPGSEDYLIVHLPSDLAFQLDQIYNASSSLQDKYAAESCEQTSVDLKEFVRFMSEEARGTYYSNVRPMDSNIVHVNCSQGLLNRTSHQRFTFAEIFGGIGGFRLGLNSLGGKCTLYSEIDADAVNTYRANFPPQQDNKNKAPPADGEEEPESIEGEDMIIGDICEYYCEDLPEFDILTAGFPCQPFSVRGDQPGTENEKVCIYSTHMHLEKNN